MIKTKNLSKSLCLVLIAILLLTLVASIFTINTKHEAYAEGLGLYIGSTEVDSDHLSGTGWSFDPATYTLTLNSFNYDGAGTTHGDATTIIYYEGADKLTIELEGGTVIKNSSNSDDLLACIFSEIGDIEFKGEGSLTAYVTGSSQNVSYGICSYGAITFTSGIITSKGGEAKWASDGVLAKDVTISGATVNAEGGNAIDGYSGINTYSVGIYTLGNLVLTDGTLTTKGKRAYEDDLNEYAYSVGTYAMGNVIISGGNYTAIGGNSDNESNGISANEVRVSGGTLNSSGGDTQTTSGISSGISSSSYTQTGGDVTTSGGYFSYYSNGLQTNEVSVTGGKFKAISGVGSAGSYGIMCDEADVVTIGANVTSFEAKGETKAIEATLANALEGLGWTNKAGTEGEAVIPVNAGTNIASYKCVSFPYEEPAPDPEPTPTPTPDPEPTPTPAPSQDSSRTDTGTGVTVETSDGTEIPQEFTLKVVVKAEITKIEGKVNPAKVQEKISSKEKIAKVYDVKLIKIVGELEQEVQPSEIKEGMKVKVEIQLPKEVKAKGLRILHVHNDGTIDEINDVAVANGVAVVEVASFSQFVLVTPAAHGFCIGWVVFIFAMLELLATGIYAILRFGLFKDIVAKLHLDGAYAKMNLLGLIGLCVSGAIFLFALIVLCLHQCAISIISFILVAIVCGFFSYCFMEDRDVFKQLKQESATIDQPIDSKDIKDIEE